MTKECSFPNIAHVVTTIGIGYYKYELNCIWTRLPFWAKGEPLGNKMSHGFVSGIYKKEVASFIFGAWTEVLLHAFMKILRPIKTSFLQQRHTIAKKLKDA